MKNTKRRSMGDHARKKARIILYPLPVQGHISPMLHLANALHSKGFSIIIIHTFFNSPHPSHFPHFSFRLIPPDCLSGSSPYEALSNLYVTCRVPFMHTLSQILSEEEHVGCLISDALWPFTKHVAHQFKLRSLVLRTASLSSFLVFDAVPLLLPKGYFSLPDAQSEQPVTEFPALRVKDLPQKITHDLMSGIVRGVKNSDGIIWNSFEELEGPAQALLSHNLSIPSFLIGPLNKYSETSAGSLLSNEKESTLSWLSNQEPKSVLYVSFGSNSRLTDAEFSEIAWGLADSGVPFLWVVRAGMVQDPGSENPFPDGFLEVVRERGHIVEWAPQKEVLAHWAVGGFWTHGGWNSTIESISEGVPLICMPCMFPDQAINSAFAKEEWKIALRIDKGANRDEITEVIRNLMVEKAGQELRENAALFKYKVDSCFAKGGSSYQSLERLTNFILAQ